MVVVLWLWCQENIVPKEIAFFDGDRRYKSDLSITRIRIRTITGKEKELKNWRLPPEEGVAYYYDIARNEWLPVTEGVEVPENSLVMGLKSRE